MHPDWDNEINNLDIVGKAIEAELAKRIGNGEEYKRQMRAINEEMWKETGVLSGDSTFDEIPGFLQEIGFLKQNVSAASENDKKIKILYKQRNSPYFSRIDFREDNFGAGSIGVTYIGTGGTSGDASCCTVSGGAEKYYIGTFGFRRAETGEILIFDWRAPISSMFYDYEPGKALYESPSGFITGELVLKRQYRIEKARLLLVFDCSVAIEDSILQDILAGSASNRMKIIVNTIQREQNRAIRYKGKRVMAVQGPAGCGKTSIALHRAAYLLYRHRDTLKAENIYLFTPNGAFTEYISAVLPDLGEEDLHCMTLVGLAQTMLCDLFAKYEPYAEMMEWQLSMKHRKKRNNRYESIHFKASAQFAEVLEAFAVLYEEKLIYFTDIANRGTVIAGKEELDELFHGSFRNMAVAKRLSRMEEIIMIRINEYNRIRQKETAEELARSPEYASKVEIKVLSRIMVARELEKVISSVKSMLSVDIKKIYATLFEDACIWSSCGGYLSEDARRQTADSLKNGILHYEDQAPVLYLMTMLGMADPDNKARHVIIDEAQDYSVTAFKLFSRLYSNCDITLLGDSAQNIYPAYGIGSLKSAAEIIGADDSEYIELDKSYRSTLEIMKFALSIMPSKTIPYGRSGEVPEIINAETTKDLFDSISIYLNELKKESYHSVAIVCRTISGCCKLYEGLGRDTSVSLLKCVDDDIPSGIVLMPSYFTKGLEFDTVIAVVLPGDEYMPDELQLFYTVCTRALHRLKIYTIEKTGIPAMLQGNGSA